MADGTAELNRWINKLRDVGSMGGKVAPVVAEALEAALVGTIAVGVTPAGEPWKPTLKGAKADLGSKLTVTPAGTAVVVQLGGKSHLHNIGIARGKIRRQVIPIEGEPLPDVAAASVAVAIDGAWKDHFEG